MKVTEQTKTFLALKKGKYGKDLEVVAIKKDKESKIKIYQDSNNKNLFGTPCYRGLITLNINEIDELQRALSSARAFLDSL